MGSKADVARRFFLVVALVATISSFCLMYQYWVIGSRLEAQLISCLG